jgi:demethylmenaquinone methyltransferase/2-methoxy-6-polyprenyl-1,4-benzoquinol methylase
MNDLMSVGVHRLWKSAMIDWLRPRAGQRMVDVAGGTGDIAFRILERQPSAHVTVCDINREMIETGRDRAIDRGMLPSDTIDWLCGDAEALPLADASQDAYTIAFGIRNVTRIEAALREARRVLKPGGRFLCLEFSHVSWPALAGLYDAYSLHVLPAIGAAVTGDGDAYRYLAESIRRFPDQRRFAAMIEDAGLGQCRHRDLSGGIVALHSAWRL